MKVKALKPFVTDELVSVACGEIIDVDSDDGAQMISDGLAEAYTLVAPTGKLSITGTAEVDCAAYATAQVSDANLVAGNIKKGVTILGVTGTYEA